MDGGKFEREVTVTIQLPAIDRKGKPISGDEWAQVLSVVRKFGPREDFVEVKLPFMVDSQTQTIPHLQTSVRVAESSVADLKKFEFDFSKYMGWPRSPSKGKD